MPAKEIVEGADDRFDHVLVSAGAALHVDVGLLVRLTALVGEPLERGLGIAFPELCPGVAARGPFGKDVDRRVQPDGNGAAVEQFARALVHISASAGRDDSDLSFDEPCHEPSLTVPEIVLAVAFEDFRGRQSGRVLDRSITVDEVQPEPAREAPPDSRLSHSHQPHEHDWPVEALRQFMHRKGYTAAPPLGKSACMSRLAVLIIILVLVIGGLVYLSTVPKEQPTHTIEVAVPQGGANGGNAH